MEVITSNKGGQKILLGGFIYSKIIGESKLLATKCRSQMKQQAKQSFDNPSQIVSQVSSEVNVSARVHIGREESRSNYRWLMGSNVRAQPATVSHLRQRA